MTFFNTKALASVQEALAVRDFYPEKCVYHWDGSGNVLETSLMLFRECGNLAKVCEGCRERKCPVRQKPNPNL